MRPRRTALGGIRRQPATAARQPPAGLRARRATRVRGRAGSVSRDPIPVAAGPLDQASPNREVERPAELARPPAARAHLGGELTRREVARTPELLDEILDLARGGRIVPREARERGARGVDAAIRA